MVKLTEDMVVARSKGSELHNIKKLNCWGSELTNVSVVRNLPNVEVLSLSVNKIATLEDFQYCNNLQELYIRKNSISDINEVLYLRQIPKLRSLWLADNPCADFDEYRLTVLRALPHLQKLDNVTVEPEEVQQAMALGLHLPMPNSNIKGGEVSEPLPRSNSMGESLRSESGGSDSSPSSSHPHQANNRQVNGFSQSLESGYDYTPNVYDEDEEQPTHMRRTSLSSHQHQQQQHEPESPYERKAITNQQYVTTQNGCVSERGAPVGEKPPHIPMRSNPPHHKQSSNQGRNSRYYEPPASQDYSEDDRVSVSSGQQQFGTPQRRQMHSGGSRPHSQRQSSPRRNSQVITTPIDSEPPVEPRPFSRSSSEYVYDSHNANNYVTRDENYVPSRRTSRDHYREHSWAGESDGYSRERGYPRSEDGHRSRDSYAGRPSHEFRSPQGEMRHFPQRPSSVGEVLQQHYDATYRRVDQQIEAASRAGQPMDRPSPTRPYPLRPKTRNANVLSAVLCLIKELDYSSLEVVEMAIRCRMDELDD